jgi:hypothetical protein
LKPVSPLAEICSNSAEPLTKIENFQGWALFELGAHLPASAKAKTSPCDSWWFLSKALGLHLFEIRSEIGTMVSAGFEIGVFTT